MSKRNHIYKTMSEIIPLYNSVQDVFDKCAKERCNSCDFKSFSLNCQAMRAAVKLQEVTRDIVKIELTNFCNEFMNTLYEAEEGTYKHEFVVSTIESALKKYLEENNKE